MKMAVNIREIINRIRNESPLLGRNGRQYIADALDALFNAYTSHFGVSASAADEVSKFVSNVTPVIERIDRGMRISVHFTHTNTHPNPSLNVGNLGSHPIIRLANWPEGSTVDFVFDGIAWRMTGARKGTSNPLMDNAALPGTDNGIYSAADHVHPADTHHGVSTVAADTAEKVVTGVTPVFDASLLRAGVRVSVHFTHANTHANPTLNVGNTSARPITNLSNWAAGSTVDFVSDGTNWRMISAKKTTDAAPQMDYVAAAGTDNGQLAREDHVHPAYVHHGICTSPAAAARKMVAEVVPAFDVGLLREGVRVTLQFIETNTHDNPTLSIGGSQPLPITNLSNWAAGSTVDFVHGNGSWRMVTPKKAGTIAPLVDLEAGWSAGTDNGHLSNEDHQHILYIDHHADHVTRGRLHLDRMPTSATPNRVLAVGGEANTSPQYQQVNDQMIANDAVRTVHIQDRNVTTEKIAERAVTGKELFTSDEDNMILRVNEAGTDPVWGKMNFETDWEGVLPVENMDVYNISLGMLNNSDVWNGITYGICTRHMLERPFQFDENKRLVIGSDTRNLVVFDDGGGRIGAWSRRPSTVSAISGDSRTGVGSVIAASGIGNHGTGNVTFVDTMVMFYRDMSMYRIYTFAWANDFSATALHNVYIKVWRLN